MDGKQSPLEKALAESMTAGRAERDALASVVDSLKSTSGEREAPPGNVDVEDILSAGRERFATVTDSALGDVARLDTFNIAFFGRTGAGKSTLLSTLGGLDGSRVSPGHSDFTTEVEPIEWNGCQLWDTPGINGWGRGSGRVQLETRARRAVEAADLVLLCFDTQSQQASEFTKVAEWVRKYDKPVIAVLNVRNPRWRHSALVSADRARQSLSKSVAEHAGNIRTELSEIDLLDVPVVAYHGRRALAARAGTPFAGPSPAGVEADRERFGIDYLEESSNVLVLEELIAAVIAVGAARLRRGALRETVRGAVQDLSTDYAVALERIAPRTADVGRRTEEMLMVLGYPGDDDPDVPARVRDLLGSAEKARGAHFGAKPRGTGVRHLQRLLTSHLSAPRARALAAVEELVKDKTDQNDQTTVAELNEILVRFHEELEQGVGEAWGSASALVQRKTAMRIAAVGLGAAEGLTAHDGLAASTGIKETIGNALRAAGAAGGGAAVAIALPNFWNPAGWVAAGIGLGGAAAGMVGDKLKRDGRKDRIRYRAATLRASREIVNLAFDDIEESVLRDFHRHLWEAAGPRLAQDLEQLLRFHSFEEELRGAKGRIDGAAADLGATADTRSVIRIATDTVAAGRAEITGRVPSTAELWLGEDWFTRGTDGNGGKRTDPAVAARFEQRSQEDQARLENWIRRVWADVDAAAAADWCAEVVAELGDAGPDAALLFGSAVDAPPVVLLGDYSVGKSSLVKRLRAEMGGTDGREIAISGAPETAEVEVHRVARLRLVDTPGFQSGRAEHDRLALEASGQAALVIVVLQVNLMVGDSGVIEQIMTGSDRLRPKGDRVLFLINRVDELGSDPMVTGNEFEQRKTLKADELRQALAARGIEIDEDRIHFVAGDPFGLYAHQPDVTADDFDENRAWDGIDALAGALLGFGRVSARNGLTRARMDALANALHRLRAELEGTVADVAGEIDRTRETDEALRNAAAAATELREAMRSAIATAVGVRADEAIDRIRACDKHDKGIVEDEVNGWHTDDELRMELERLIAEHRNEVRDLVDEHSRAIGRRLDDLDAEVAPSAAGTFQAAGGAAAGAVGVGAKGARFGEAIVKTFGNRDVVYAIGKAFRVKFRPWGAVNAAGKVAKAAPILGLAAMAMEGYAMYADNKTATEWAAQRADAERRVRERAVVYAGVVIDGDSSTPTPARALAEFADWVESNDRELQDVIETRHQHINDQRERIERIDVLLRRGDELSEMKGN